MTEIDHIVSLIQRTFERDAWHGPSVKEVLEKLSPEDARKKFPGTHSIIELVNHMTAWRTYTIKRITSDPAYEVPEALNFPQSTDWPRALVDLHASQQQLISALETFPPKKLHELVTHTSNPLTYYTLLHGIIHHDLYHTGQIMLIFKGNSNQ